MEKTERDIGEDRQGDMGVTKRRSRVKRTMSSNGAISVTFYVRQRSPALCRAHDFRRSRQFNTTRRLSTESVLSAYNIHCEI